MKKLVALLLGTAMVTTSVMGLVACNKKPTEKPDHTEHVDADNNGKCDVCGEDMGTVGPGPEVTYADRRVDPRAVDAYEAYDYEGNKVGAFKTIADAINATVEADLDFMEDEEIPDGSKGGYVMKKGGTRHLFDNTKGYGSGNSDVFWYYENGSELTAYNCWDNNFSIATLHNSKVITHETTAMGLQSVQSWNGYGLLDEKGREIDSNDAMPQSYELGSAMDASVLMFTGESKGVAGLKYVIDLSEVEITPAYEGFEDKVYAFIGIYAWQGYYVVANGIACDTETGDWYEYLGTSRDDSFSDVEYNIGKKIMSSTWVANSDTKGDGYWAPNAKEMELEIRTTRQHDDYEDEDYFEDVYTIKLDGELAFNTAIGADTVNNLFSGANYNLDNTYVFTAGLDIKNNISTGVRVENVDYFNGAKFLNLVVTEAYVYFPTQEEISDTEAGMIINENWRGKYMDVLLANDVSADGAYAYTILQTYACTSYEAKDGVDYYSFRYDGSPVSENEIGGQLKVYQDAIDDLANMTVENINNYLETFFAVGKWYGDDASHSGSTLLQQYLNLLDFAPYEAAVKIYEDSLKLSDAASAILEDLRKLSTITAYGTATGTTYLGWKAPEGTQDVTGYLFSELEIFHAIKARYDALTDETDKLNIVRLYGETLWDTWVEFDEDVYALLANTDLINSLSFNTFTTPMKADKTTYEGLDVFTTMVDWIFKIKAGSFTGDENDGQGTGVMNFDGSAYPSIYLTPFILYLEEVEGFKFPGFILDQLDAVEYDSFYSELWYPITNNILLGAKVMNGYEITDLTEDELAFLNEVWTNGYVLGGQISWNWISGAKFATYYQTRMTRIVLHVGADTKFFVSDYIDAIANWLAGYGYEINVNGWGTTADVIEVNPDDSDAAKAIVARIAALSDLTNYTYLGWTTEDANISGYLYSEILEYRAIAEAYAALTANEKIYVGTNINTAAYTAWGVLSNEFLTVENSNAWTMKYKMLVKPYDSSYAMQEYTAAEAMNELIKIADVIAAGEKLADSGDDVTGTTVINGDANFFTSLRLVSFYHFFKANGVVLPEFVAAKLEAVGTDTFYTNFFYPLYYTVALAQRMTDDKVVSIEDLTEAELAFLNEVWTVGYEMKAPLTTHYNNKFVWWSHRVSTLVVVAGGNGAAADLMGYINLVGAFLTRNSYTLNANGWGVNAEEIRGITLSADVIAFIDTYGKLSSLGSYTYKGWTTDEAAFAGYLFTEVNFFTETLVPMYEALSDSDKVIALELVGETNYDAWTELAAEIIALNENEAFLNASIVANDGTYSGKDALGQLINAFSGISTTTGFYSDSNFNDSYRVVFFMQQFEDLGITLPNYVYDKYDAVTVTDNAIAMEGDLLYLDAVLKLYALVKDGGELELNETILSYIEKLVGRTQFNEAGLNWNFSTTDRWGSDPQYSDFTARGSAYKAYYGIATTVRLDTIITTVINYLVENCGATAINYTGTTDVLFGIDVMIEVE